MKIQIAPKLKCYRQKHFIIVKLNCTTMFCVNNLGFYRKTLLNFNLKNFTMKSIEMTGLYFILFKYHIFMEEG